MTNKERELLDKANGKVLFFYLSGPMIFSVSKAITRQHSSIADYKVMILDLTDVPMIDVTVGLALENAIKDALDAECEVLLLCPHNETSKQLDKLNVLELLSNNNHFSSREEALQFALDYVTQNDVYTEF